MKKQTLKVIVALLLTAVVVLATLCTRKGLENRQTEKQAVNDSIILLNKLWVQENQRYIGVMVALDSISRKGGTLPFSNFKGKVFELNLIAK